MSAKTTTVGTWAAFDEDSWNDINDTFGQRPGTYRLRLKTADLGDWQPVARLVGSDPEGTLYIGMSRTVTARISALRAGLYGAYRFKGGRGNTFSNPGAHQCSRRMPVAFLEAVDRSRYFIEITGFPPGVNVPEDFDVSQEETAAIARYAATYGESPPFNATWSRLDLPAAVEE